MSSDEKKKREPPAPAAETPTPSRILLNPEEWVDPAGVEVIKEYHKDGLPGTEAGDESDLDAFERQWNVKGGSQTAGEYHKRDEPDMEERQERDDQQRRGREASKEALAEESHPGKESPRNARSRGDEKEVSSGSGLAAVTREELGKVGSRVHDLVGTSAAPPRPPLVDISTVEVLAFTVFRAMFGQGVRVPMKVEGSMDMEIAVKDTDVVINTNDVGFEPPKLQIWHFIFAYRGRPVLEYGRGVERIKIHYYRAFVLLIASWWGGKRKRKAKDKAAKTADQELTRFAADGERPGEKEGTGGDQ